MTVTMPLDIVKLGHLILGKTEQAHKKVNQRWCAKFNRAAVMTSLLNLIPNFFRHDYGGSENSNLKF